MKKIVLVICFAFLFSKAFAQADLLQAGPMLGYSAWREVLIWAQTKKEANVHFEYWEKGNPQSRQKSDKVLTKKTEAFTAKIPIELLESGKKYEYEIFINDKKVLRPYLLEFQTQELWRWRKDAPDFKFAFGSCVYVNELSYDRPGKPYGSGYPVFNTIQEKKPDFMLWGGDNVYLREGDLDSQSGIFHRYTHTRALPEMQSLLASTHNYAIWDDHDYGSNDSDRAYPFKDLTLNTFKLFWGNPNYGLSDKNGKGITGTFLWGDAQFFLLDNRYFRSPNNNFDTKRVMFDDEQIDWLIDALNASEATFKFIVAGGQILNPAAKFEVMATYPEERQKLLERIRKSKVNGVIFLTGDRHLTEMAVLKENAKHYPFYELTSSSLTSGTANLEEDEKNYLRIPETLLIENNFCMLEMAGTREERQLKVICYDAKGVEKWHKIIFAKDLRY